MGCLDGCREGLEVGSMLGQEDVNAPINGIIIKKMKYTKIKFILTSFLVL